MSDEMQIVQDALQQGYYEQYEKKIYDQKQLIFISKALNSNLDLGSLIDSILNISLAQSQTFQVGIYLQPEIDRHEFFLKDNYIGFDLNPNIAYELDDKTTFINALNTSSWGTFTMEDLREIDENSRGAITDEIRQFESLSPRLLLIPLRARGRVNGVIVLGPKTTGEPYLSSEKEFLSDLASIAAIAVENARLYELATTDMMTRLKIHHFFQTRLREEMEECQVSGSPVSLLLTDIDHFKKFNDTFGHQIGDLVLIEVAKTLIRIGRALDVPSRYGGEEFALILPKTRLDDAVRIAEKVRESVEKTEVVHPTSGEILRVTISVGVAECDAARDKTNADIIKRCDDALYAAKRNGRNRVELG